MYKGVQGKDVAPSIEYMDEVVENFSPEKKLWDVNVKLATLLCSKQCYQLLEIFSKQMVLQSSMHIRLGLFFIAKT